MRTFLSLAAVATMAVGLWTGGQVAQAATFSFYNITNNSENGVLNPDVSSQLLVDVTDEGGGEVGFNFRNIGPLDSSIARIYFDDGTLLGISSIDDSHPGVDFVVNAGPGPGDLPGGDDISPKFDTTADFLAKAVQPPSHNGVEPGEWVKIVFNLISGQSYADLIAALALGGAEGGLRIGLHVIGLSNEGSDSYINNPTPIPLPAGLVLFLSGLAGVGFLGRYKARRRETAAA